MKSAQAHAHHNSTILRQTLCFNFFYDRLLPRGHVPVGRAASCKDRTFSFRVSALCIFLWLRCVVALMLICVLSLCCGGVAADVRYDFALLPLYGVRLVTVHPRL